MRLAIIFAFFSFASLAMASPWTDRNAADLSADFARQSHGSPLQSCTIWIVEK